MTTFATARTALETHTDPYRRCLAALRAVTASNPELTDKQLLAVVKAAAAGDRDVTALLRRPATRTAMTTRIRQAEPALVGVAAARRLVGAAVVNHPSLSPAAVVKARVAGSLVGDRILRVSDSVWGPATNRQQWRSIWLTGPDLGLALGLSKQTAVSQLRAADAATISIVKVDAGVGFRVTSVPARGSAKAAAGAHPITVAALAAWEPERDLLAAVIASVEHPIWGYALGHRLWASWIDVVAGTLGTRAERNWRRKLTAAGINPDCAPGDVLAMLDLLAAESAATARRAEAEQLREQQRTARGEEMALAKRLGSNVSALMTGCPDPDADLADREAWLAGAIELAEPAPADVRPMLRRLLAARLRRRGYGDVASRIAGLIAPDV